MTNGQMVHTCLGTCPAYNRRMILCPKSAAGPNISGQPPVHVVAPVGLGRAGHAGHRHPLVRQEHGCGLLNALHGSSFLVADRGRKWGAWVRWLDAGAPIARYCHTVLPRLARRRVAAAI